MPYGRFDEMPTMDNVVSFDRLRFRTVWLSDIHLGFRGCSAEYLVDFLDAVECEYLYLVGDIIDIWSLKRKSYWPQAHNDVVRKILSKARWGTKVILIPGNHDETLRDFVGMQFGNIQVADRWVHRRADGRRFLVLHGDQFDSVVRSSKALTLLGDKAYEWLLQANLLVNRCRRWMGWSYWSLAAFIKHKVPNAAQYISNFEQAVAFDAARQGVDGVVCGHIHRAEITEVNGILYCNCGDWVESCTALVERHDSAMELIHWSDRVMFTKTCPAAA